MKIGIISDVEGNHIALEKVIRLLSDCRFIFNLGDMVGSQGDSNKAIDLIRKHNIISVIGNHDLEILFNKSVAADKFMAEMLYGTEELYQSKIVLDSENLEYLKTLKLSVRARYKQLTISFFHSLYGKYANELYFEYVNSNNANDMLKMSNSNLTFIGHKHIPSIVIAETNGKITGTNIDKTTTYELRDDFRYVINSGSVGAPRNKIINTSYSVLDLNSNRVKIHVL